MITAIDIEGLRGIRQGALEGLAPLTVLTGPNSSGKSTVLEALSVVAAPQPFLQLQDLTRRRAAGGRTWRWLMHRGEGKDLRLKALSDWPDPGHAVGVTLERKPVSAEQERLQVFVDAPAGPRILAGKTIEGAGGSTAPQPLDNWPSAAPRMRFIDPNRNVDLAALYEQAYVAGRKGEVLALLREILPAVDDFTYLPSGVHISYDGRGAVPAGVEGEGVLAFLRLALELAGPSEGLVLLEEPETFQHPASLVRSARAMVAAVRRGMQLVLTTHSLELVDRLLDEAQAQGLPTDQLALFNLRLDAGKLLSSRFDGESVLDGRRILDQDLR